LYKEQGDTLFAIYNLNGGGHHIDEGNGQLILSAFSFIEMFNPETFERKGYNFLFTETRQAVALADGSIWVADYTNGIAKSEDNLSYKKPNGPVGLSSFDIYAYDRNVLVAHGAVSDNWVFRFKNDGFSEYKDGQWI